MPQAMKIPDAKAAAWQLEKVMAAVLEAQKEKNKTPLCRVDGPLSS